MKKNLMVSLLLAVIICLSLAACSQQETASEHVGAEEPPAEQAETVPEDVPTSEPEAASGTDEQTQAVTEESPSGENEAETAPEESLETATDTDDYENSEVYKEFMEMMEAMGGSPVQSEGNTSSTPEPEPDPYYEEPFELPTRTHEEARAVITEIADNFKSGPYYSELEGPALEYLDVNLETLRTNPESSDYLKSFMTDYEKGALSEEMFIYAIESWVRIAGPYGGKEIIIQ